MATRAPEDREPELETSAEPPVYSVSALTRAIGSRLSELGRLRVEGELSDYLVSSTGHAYFKLKEGNQAVLGCVVWKSQLARALRFEPAAGQQVVATGKLDVYAPRGSYSLIVERLETRGLGELLLQLERLKGELRARGWFDRKRPLPALPRTIGVVTSRDGAAWRDFQKTRELRWPGYPLRLCHSLVQGAGAAEQIARAIARLEESGVDAIALIRGGGSLEDLWAFNELPVAEAIWRCSVPVVSGVGHETDTTLADLVADRRAHTPTDAAQTLIPSRSEYMGKLERATSYLLEAMHGLLAERAQCLRRLAGSRELAHPQWILGDRAERLRASLRRVRLAQRGRCDRASACLERLQARLARRDPRHLLAPLESRLRLAGGRLLALRARPLERARARLAELSRSLEATSPLAVLGRGYSITFKLERGERGLAVRDARELEAGQEVLTRLAQGTLRSRVSGAAPAEGPGKD